MNEHDVIELAHRNLGDVLQEITRRCGGTVLDQDGLVLVAANHPCPAFVNSALRTGPCEANDVLRRIGVFFGARGHHCETWIRDGVDADLERAAVAAGMRVAVELSGMVLDCSLDAVDPRPGVEVRKVTDRPGLQCFTDVAAEGFQQDAPGLGELVRLIFSELRSLIAPDTAAYVVWDHGEPASAAMTLVKNGVAWIGWVATRPQYRGRGLAGLATAAATRAGFSLGAKFASLEATKLGEPVYRRLGYREVTRYRTYWPAEFAG